MRFVPFALYMAAFGAYVWHFARREAAVGRAATTLLIAAAFAHTFLIGMETVEIGHVPFAGTTSAICTFVWLLALAYLYTELTTEERAMGAFILLPIADLILFRFGSSEIHLAILGVLMLAIILFMPRGVLPTLHDWLERRAAPRSAFSGARSMAEHVDQSDAARDQPAASERGAP